MPELLSAAEHVIEDKDTEEDPRLLLATGSSLGARPKASVIENDGQLAIAKFPRRDVEINTVGWEAVALALAAKSGIPVPEAHGDGLKQTRDSPAPVRSRRQAAHSLLISHEHAGREP